MGLMRFHVFPTERITEEMMRQAYLSGFDGLSWPVRVSVEGETLLVQRSVSDSASLYVPWAVEKHGRLTLASATLMERPEPYLLPLEIARGSIVELRNQICEWQLIGLSVPKAVAAKVSEAVERFSWAAVAQEEPAASAGYAEAALRAALDAGELLVAAYTKQVLSARRRNEGKLASLLGANLGATLLDNYVARQFLLTFNAAAVPLAWRDVETTEGNFSWSTGDKQIKWCRKHGLKVLAGPLLLLDPRALPDWLYLFEDDFDSLLDFVSAFVRSAVERYRGTVDYWICAGRVNTGEVLSLSETERLRLAARTVEVVRSLDPDTPALVSFDQPWAEYMRQQESDFPPLHFADVLSKAGADLSGLMLEINVGDSLRGTLPRPPLEFNRLLDSWSALGLPLWLSLSAPSANCDDPLAQYKATVAAGSWTPAAQRDWVARFVPLALAKPMVRGLLWNQLRDNELHDFPNGGLFDDRCQRKPAVRTLASLRHKYMK